MSDALPGAGAAAVTNLDRRAAMDGVDFGLRQQRPVRTCVILLGAALALAGTPLVAAAAVGTI